MSTEKQKLYSLGSAAQEFDMNEQAERAPVERWVRRLDRPEIKERRKYLYDGKPVWVHVIVKSGRGWSIVLVNYDPSAHDFYEQLYAKKVWRLQSPLKPVLAKLEHCAA